MAVKIIICIGLIILGTIGYLVSSEVEHFKNYGYKITDYPLPWGSIELWIIETEKKVDATNSVETVPYTLNLSATLNSTKSPDFACHVSVTSIQLVNTNNGAVVLSKSNLKSNFSFEKGGYEKGSYKALFYFPGLALDYVDYDLDIKISVKDCLEKNTEEHLRIPIKTQYQERSITFMNQ